MPSRAEPIRFPAPAPSDGRPRPIRIGRRDALPIALLVLTLVAMLLPVAARAAAPIDVVFVLDNSGSMRTHDPAFLTRRAVLAFARDLAVHGRTHDAPARIGVVLFDDSARLVLPLTPLDPETVDATLSPALAGLDYDGQWTRSADAIERALYALRTESAAVAHRAIVLLTDGRLDTGNAQRDLEAAKWLRDDLAAESHERGIRIFGLAFTDRADYQLLQALAHTTDAAYYRAGRADELGPIAHRILAQLTQDGLQASSQATQDRPHEDPMRHSAAQDDAVGGGPATTTDAALAPVSASPAGPAATGTPAFRSRLGWLPLALLVAALAALSAFRLRARSARTSGSGADAVFAVGAPAQLLDVGGVLGETGRALPLSATRTRIGRDAHNEVVIADDTVSSEHAVIERVEGRYWLEDLRSTNGTRHADRRLAPGERVLLKGGDHVRFAEIDLMFVYPGHLPGGATMVLPSTSATPSGGSLSRSGTPGPRPAADARARSAPGGLASVTPLFDERSSEAFRACLDDHLARVAALSTDFAAFVARAFDEDMREAIRIAANELVRTAQRENRLARRLYMRDRVRYVLCAVAGDLADAARAYQAGHGGFSRFLSEELDDERFRDGRCRVLAVLTCGRASGLPWFSLSLVPDLAHHQPIDLMSYELLSPSERAALEQGARREVSQSGLA